jgi:uncharacterized RDD family membrane protein YckC
MNWYYLEAGQQAGPVDDVQLEELRRSGRVEATTLVWCEGMAHWQPYGEVKPSAGSGGASTQGAAAVATAPVAVGGDQAVCAECGGIFNIQDTISYGTMRVCANCKPAFMQKLAEGARLNTGAMTYARFWTRFAAVFVDGIILWVVNFVLQMGAVALVRVSSSANQGPMAAAVVSMLLMVVSLAIALSYEVVMIGKYGATLGKMACKIKVVTADGGRVSYLRALGRYFAKMLSGLILGIGYLMAAFDEEKRALHDRICDTRVIVR